jgi:hypothetical protein
MAASPSIPYNYQTGHSSPELPGPNDIDDLSKKAIRLFNIAKSGTLLSGWEHDGAASTAHAQQRPGRMAEFTSPLEIDWNLPEEDRGMDVTLVSRCYTEEGHTETAFDYQLRPDEPSDRQPEVAVTIKNIKKRNGLEIARAYSSPLSYELLALLERKLDQFERAPVELKRSERDTSTFRRFFDRLLRRGVVSS